MKAATTKRNGADLGKKAPPTKKPTNPLEQLAWALTSVISNTELRLAKEIEDEGHQTRNSLIHWGEALQSYWVRSTQKADVQAGFKDSKELMVSWFDSIQHELNLMAEKVLKLETPQIDREMACIRSDTLAILRIREGDMARLSRVELLLDQLVARPSLTKPKTVFYSARAKGDGSGRNWDNACTTQAVAEAKVQPGDVLFVDADSTVANVLKEKKAKHEKRFRGVPLKSPDTPSDNAPAWHLVGAVKVQKNGKRVKTAKTPKELKKARKVWAKMTDAEKVAANLRAGDARRAEAAKPA